MNQEILCGGCRRIGHVEDADYAYWESDGETDSTGRMIGVCPGCLTQEEEHDAVDTDVRGLCGDSGEEAGT